MSRVALSILTAVTDVKFLRFTLPHISRFCSSHVFAERVLFLDSAPLSGHYARRRDIGTFDELCEIAHAMVDAGHYDRVEIISYKRDIIKATYRRHFSRDIKFTHDFRGYPIFGSIYAIENCNAGYVLHFDSDILGYAPPGVDWITEAVERYEAAPDVLFIAPRSGPPRDDGELHQRGVPFNRDPRGFYTFSDFTSRKFLVSKRRLQKVLPVEPVYISWKRRLLSQFINQSPLWNWEVMMTHALKKNGLLRADMMVEAPWCLHTPDHSPEFIRNLPDIIRRIESGESPPEQAGHYDLDLDLWIDRKLNR